MSRYLDEAQYSHAEPERLGVLLLNLGTPDAPTTREVRRYLAEFLWDPRVVETPRPLWWLILHGVILRFRPARSAAAYRKVWSDEGSPLLVHGRAQAAGLATRLRARLGFDVPVALGMRYGNPAIADALEDLRAQNVRRLLVLPLYPQYSATTTASTFDATAATLMYWRWLPELRMITHYHDRPDYIAALAATVREHWARDGRGEHLLMSFHGLPRRYLLAGDPYHCHCHKTARLLAEALELGESEWTLSFQSRVGREEWLRPYTDETVQALGAKGLGRLDVICPGFSADCLETLEEIAMQNHEFFVTAGGGELRYIPALNARDDHLEMLTDLVLQHARGWPETAAGFSSEQARRDVEPGAARARALGAER